MGLILSMLVLIVYLTIGGVCAGLSYCSLMRRRSGTKTQKENCASSSVIMGVVWPIAMPIFVPLSIFSKDTTPRVEQKRDKEIDEAEHRVELARLAAEEAEYIDRQLSAAKR